MRKIQGKIYIFLSLALALFHRFFLQLFSFRNNKREKNYAKEEYFFSSYYVYEYVFVYELNSAHNTFMIIIEHQVNLVFSLK